MSKGLEVLEHLRDYVLTYTENETDRRFIFASCEELEKELKALKIIKEKGVCIPALELTVGFEKDNLEEYNKISIRHFVLPLLQEEYDLLKEVLL